MPKPKTPKKKLSLYEVHLLRKEQQKKKRNFSHVTNQKAGFFGDTRRSLLDEALGIDEDLEFEDLDANGILSDF